MAIKKTTTKYKAEPITFSEIDGVRYLHFSTPWVQGAMNLKKPFKLELEYAQMMMSYILFLDEPKHVAQLGMGCASLTKFIQKNMKKTHSTVVELSPDVISAAYTMFQLPRHKNISVVEMDAAIWITQQKKYFDVLQIDLYDANAHGPVCDSIEFYQDCFNALKNTGIATINLFGDHPSFIKNMKNLNLIFNNRVLALPEIHEGNRIALAFKGAPINLSWKDLYNRAEIVKEQYGLKAKRWVSGLKSAVPNDHFTI